MSEADGAATDQVDNWVFDSLVNFLHGSIWKVPVVGFIEEKSVVFDPDSYNNMTEEKEEEFRKIHDEYKTVVDFMLTSFMEDLQVTPEQVEEACRVREHQSKTLPESHITKVALEQLWAAEDFTAFRRLMTRKNIDLQLQSLELLVAKYGVLSPALRSGDIEDPAGEDGEDDFLQVVIRYSDQLETFKCDYGAEAAGSGFGCRSHEESAAVSCRERHNDYLLDEEDKNMQLHLAGVTFKNNIAPTPVHYQATLTSSPPTSSSSLSSNTANNHAFTSPAQIEKQSSENHNDNENIDNIETSSAPEAISDDEERLCEDENSNMPSESAEGAVITSAVLPESLQPDLSITQPTNASPTPPPSPSPPNENFDNSTIEEVNADEIEPTPRVDSTPQDQDDNESKVAQASKSEHSVIETGSSLNSETETGKKETAAEKESESQLIQLEEAEAAIEEESNIGIENAVKEGALPSPPPPPKPKPQGEPLPQLAPLTLPSHHFDEKTAAEIASTAPEQRRLLTAVRKALEINPDESGGSAASIDIPKSMENDGDLQKRREYLRAQRDKLIAMKKLEREKLLLDNSSAGGSQQSARPKSARAAQIAIKNPNNMRAASLSSERSLSARRALADRLKQELIEK